MRLRSGLTLALGLALIGASAVSAPATGAETVAPTPVLVGDYTDSQWNLVATSLEAVHVAGHTGEGVTIAILDSDYDGTHPEIAPNVVESFVVEGTTVKEVAPQEMNSSETHGTHVAGIAAGVADGVGMTGVAPDADLILGAVAWEKSDPDLWPSVIAGLDHVAGRADVINLSLGQPEVLLSPELAEALCAAVGNATAKGSVVVIAAGNSGVDGNPAMLPAGCETAVTVTALDPDLSLAYFSSFEGFVSVSAPGTDILGPMARAALQGTSFAVEPRPLIPMSGTSMAAPFVAGVAALVLEAFPDMTPVEVRQRLTSTAQDRGAKGYDPDYGYGAVDPAAAVGEDALPAPTPTAFPSYLSFQPMDLETDSYVAAQWSPGGAGGEIEGYTITALGYGSDDSWTVDAREVRNLMEVEPAAAWYALTVHTSEGSYTTPYWPVPFGGGQSGIADLRARWVEGNRLRVFWTLAEPVPAGTVLTVDVIASAPQGFDAFRRVTIDPRGRISGSRTIDVAAPGPSPEVRSGLRQYAAGSWAVASACLGNSIACLSADVSPKYPVAVTLTPTGRRTGTLALALNMPAMEGCPVRAGAPRCEGVVARVSVGGRDLVARFNTQGVAFLPVDRAPGASVVPAVVTVPALERGGPFRLNIVTENDGSFG